MTLDSLNRKENLSVRSFNICNDSGLHDLESLISYFSEHKTFLNLRHCGEKTNDELIAICNKYSGMDLADLVKNHSKKDPIIDIINNLSFSQREVINSYIQISIQSLSVRSNNAIEQILEGNYRLKNFLNKIYSNDFFNIYDVKNVGQKSAEELNQFLNDLKDFITEISNEQNNTNLSFLKNQFFIQSRFSVKEVPNELCTNLTVFGLTDFLIHNNLFFGKNYDPFLCKSLKIFDDFIELTLEELAEEFSFTRERARQIRLKLTNELLDQLSYTRSIEDDLNQNYGIDTSEKYLLVSDEKLLKIQEKSSTNFSKEFTTYVLYSYCIDHFNLIGEISDVIQHKSFKSKGRHNWSNFYLIQKDICSKFDFERFANNISGQLEERRNEDYSLNFKSFLSQFITKGGYEIINEVIGICEDIINHEFNLFIDLDESLFFKRNTVKQVYEYAIEILEEIGEPTKIEDLFERLSLKNPDITKNATALSGSIRRSNEIIYFGRSSTFGLRRWEKEKEGVKGGTIRSITEEFLESKSDPIHISEITENVVLYRPNTNEKSVYSNLKMDQSGSFTFYQKSFIGLSRKTYDSSFLPLSDKETVPRKNWDDRLEDLITFLNENDRLPYSSGVSEEEIRLYRWYCIQKNKKGELKENRKKLLQNLLRDYENIINSTQKRLVNNSERFAKLYSFLKEKKRLPSASLQGEERLYTFMYKLKKSFEQELLSKHDREQFLEILQLIKNNYNEN